MKVVPMKTKPKSITSNKITTPLKVFSNWNEARAAGFYSKTHWQKKGRGIKGRPSAVIKISGEQFNLYRQDQTTTQSPRTIAANALVNRFVRREDIAGYQLHHTQDWKQFRPIHGLRSLVKSGWHLEKCHATGIGQIKAQAFSVRTAEKTSFFCIDLDCHNPTSEMAKVHLALVQAVAKRLPELLNQLGGGSSFAQYRQIETSGIQLWGTTSEINTKALHKTIRDRLVELGPDLDKKLKRVGLPSLGQIEIAPTEQKQISVPGCYGKTVFTSKELKVTDGWFDVVGLNDHISKCLPLGDVFPRYSELLKVSAGIFEPIKIPTIPTQKHPSPSGRGMPLQTNNKIIKRDYWTNLTDLASNGVPEPDHLFNYLLRLAQGLVFRDYFNNPQYHELAVEELLSWVKRKSNGLVSRLESERLDLLKDEIERAVSLVESSTVQAVKDYWQSVRNNDLKYPEKVERLTSFMREGVKPNTYSRTIGKCTALPRKSFDSKELPQAVFSRIEQAAKKHIKSSPQRKRFIQFSQRFINSIASNPGKSIGWQKLNEMAGKKGKKQRTTQNQFKNILVKAGILKPDWERTIIRNQSAAKYSLTEWAKEQIGI